MPTDKLRRGEQRREQVLDRLWEIAIMSPEITRGSLTGQVKAIQMIVAIEGFIPDRRSSSSAMLHPAASQVPEPKPASSPAPKPVGGMSFPDFDPNPPGVFNPFVNRPKRAPAPTNYVFDAVLDKAGPLNLSFPPDQRVSGLGR